MSVGILQPLRPKLTREIFYCIDRIFDTTDDEVITLEQIKQFAKKETFAEDVLSDCHYMESVYPNLTFCSNFVIKINGLECCEWDIKIKSWLRNLEPRDKEELENLLTYSPGIPVWKQMLVCQDWIQDKDGERFYWNVLTKSNQPQENG